MQAKAGVMSESEAFRIIQHYGGLNYFPLHRVQEERSGLAQLLGGCLLRKVEHFLGRKPEL